MLKRLFVSGIGTDIGKTIVSAVLTEALHADYWKPIQAGGINCTDSMTVQSLISNPYSKIHPETYLLQTPASPHYAAELENIDISLDKIQLPNTYNNCIVIEGAGGLLVPLNHNTLIIDLIEQLNAEVVLVVKNYLGSINHTLLSVEALKQRNIPIVGIVFNGETAPHAEEYVLEYSRLKCLAKVRHEPQLSKEIVKQYAQKIDKRLLLNNSLIHYF